ncbi:MAG: sulfotransferase domain-containing protein [Rhizobiaceae bacterium]
MRLSFLIAGVQKGGTTALYQFLREHRQLFLPKRKELHFFDDETIDWSRPDYERLYHSHFAEAGPVQKCGEATPIYSYWPPSMERIRAYNPDIKIVISLRDPRDRAYSHWRMEKARNVETLSFSEAIRQGRRRVGAGSEIRGYHRDFSYVERGLYVEQLNRIFLLFPGKNVLLLDQRDLKSKHREVLDGICDFIGVERFTTYPPAETVFSHRNEPIPAISAEDRAYLTGIFAEELHALNETYRIAFPLL